MLARKVGLAAMLALGFIFVIGIIYWNKRLSKEIELSAEICAPESIQLVSVGNIANDIDFDACAIGPTSCSVFLRCLSAGFKIGPYVVRPRELRNIKSSLFARRERNWAVLSEIAAWRARPWSQVRRASSSCRDNSATGIRNDGIAVAAINHNKCASTGLVDMDGNNHATDSYLRPLGHQQRPSPVIRLPYGGYERQESKSSGETSSYSRGPIRIFPFRLRALLALAFSICGCGAVVGFYCSLDRDRPIYACLCGLLTLWCFCASSVLLFNPGRW